MAATVVSVVIFLCGVLVGRGVRVERGGVPDTPVTSSIAETTPQQPAAAPVPAPAGSDPTVAAPPPPAADDLTYFNRLEKPKSSAEDLKAAAGPRGGPPLAKSSPAPASKAPSVAAAKAPEAASSASAEPAGKGAELTGQGYAVQIA